MSSQLSDADSEPEVQTQEVIQTQNVSSQEQEKDDEYDENLWAMLVPMTKEMKQIDLFKARCIYRFGRNTTHNAIVFPGYKISNKHAEICWDGHSSKESIITLTDLSSNGTYINGSKVGKGRSAILTDGVEVAFGSTTTSPTNPLEDYRFIFRHAASGKRPKDGFYGLYDTGYQLGRGTFASVIKCLERSTGTMWAAKLFSNPVNVASTSNLASKSDTMVSREITILQKLSHPNICFLKDTFILPDGKLVLVLELIEGGDLLEYILSNAGVSEEMTQHITYHLCLALSYVHSLGIAHRDLKPENVLLTKDDPPNVKVADFGLAKAADSQTMLKTMCGTPAYLAPEVVQQTNMEGYDNLVDSWSVGVIVFSMITNASPFVEDETQLDIRMRIATRKVDWSILREKTANENLIRFIAALLDDEPQSRMTLTGALDHPWLQDYVTRTGRDSQADRNLGKMQPPEQSESSDSTPVPTTPTANGEVDKQPGSAVFSRGFENLAINDRAVAGPSSAGVSLGGNGNGQDADMDANSTPPPASQGPKLQSQNSRILRRRRDVLDEAQEGETTLSQPSPELLSQFDQKHNRMASGAESKVPAVGPSNPKRQGKRAHGDLSSVPEGEAASGSGGANGENVAMDVDTDMAVDSTRPTPSKRLRETPPTTGARKQKSSKSRNTEPTPVRRSGRNKSA